MVFPMVFPWFSPWLHIFNVLPITGAGAHHCGASAAADLGLHRGLGESESEGNGHGSETWKLEDFSISKIRIHVLYI